MTDDDAKLTEAFKACADARLPDDFADRLVKRIRGGQKPEEKKPLAGTLVRMALVAASLTLLLGFVPNVLTNPTDSRSHPVAQVDTIRPTTPALPHDSQLNALGVLGLCHEAIRRRVRSLFARSRRREDEE